jgi:hypothetical protein
LLNTFQVYLTVKVSNKPVKSAGFDEKPEKPLRGAWEKIGVRLPARLSLS